MADNVSIHRDQFNLIIKTVDDWGKMLKDKRGAKDKSVEKIINGNRLARVAAMKILAKYKKKSPAKDQIHDQEDKMEFDEDDEVDEQNVDHENPDDVEDTHEIAVNVSKRFGRKMSPKKYEFYEKVFKAM